MGGQMAEYVDICQRYSDARYPGRFGSFEVVGGGADIYGVVGEALDGSGASIHLTLQSDTHRILDHKIHGVTTSTGGGRKKRKNKPRH